MGAVTIRRAIETACVLGALAFAATGRAQVAPDATFGENGLVRTTFGTPGFPVLSDMLIQPDGLLLAAGHLDGTSIDGGVSVAMARYFPDGALDSMSFGAAGRVAARISLRDRLRGIALQGDGKIVGGGQTAPSNFGSQQDASVYRFNTDGSFDTTFSSDGTAALEFTGSTAGEVEAVFVRGDGEIIAGGRGNLSAAGGSNCLGTALYSSGGSLDANLALGAPASFSSGSCAFQSDGSRVQVGFDINTNNLMVYRVTAGGGLDATFAGGSIVTGIPCNASNRPRVLVQSDGKVLVGATEVINFNTQWMLLRYRADGTPDSTFGTNGKVTIAFAPNGSEFGDMAVAPDGKIVAGGRAPSGFGTAALARLLPDGSPDLTFAPDGKYISPLVTSGTNSFTRVMVLPDGRILAAGQVFPDAFILARFSVATTAVETRERAPATSSLRVLGVFPNPARAAATVRMLLTQRERVRVTITDAAGRTVRRLFDGDLAAGTQSIRWDGRDDAGAEVPSGVHVARLSTAAGDRLVRMIRLH